MGDHPTRITKVLPVIYEYAAGPGDAPGAEAATDDGESHSTRQVCR